MAHSSENDGSFYETPLFKGIPKNRIPMLLECLKGSFSHLEPDEDIQIPACSKGVFLYILDGCVRVVVTDMQGNNSILSEYPSGSLISCEDLVDGVSMTNSSITSLCESDVLQITLDDEYPPCTEFAMQVRDNVISILLDTGKRLKQRLYVLSERSTRNKVLAFLRQARQDAKNDTFEIPYSRQELADYLYVERSALSREISKLQEDGFIKYKKNTFTALRML